METTEPTMGRRAVLAAGAGAAAASMAPAVAAQDDGGSGVEAFLADANNYDGVVDRTGQEEVTVEVGAGENGLAFGPPGVRVSPGTTVVWEWTGEGGAHNVEAVDDAFRSGDPVGEAGTTFEHTFEEPGSYRYVCEPHEAANMLGAVVVAPPDPTPKVKQYLAEAPNYDGIHDLRGQDTATVDVGVGENGVQFGPAAIRVDPGTTVRWEWTGEGGTHNVVASDGTFDSGSPEAGGDVTFEYTFEDRGYWTYVCEPHETLQMKGAVVVGDAGAGGEEGEDGGLTGGGPPDALTFGAVTTVLLFPVLIALGLFVKAISGGPSGGRAHS